MFSFALILAQMIKVAKILDFFIPRACAGCGIAGEAFCTACMAESLQKSFGCLLCGFRNKGEFCAECRRKRKPALNSAIWAGRYDGKLKQAIWELKYGKRREMARPLAELLVRKANALREPSLVIPIPLHFKRRHERGFNQAELLAREFSKITGIPARTDILEKIKETPAQVEVQDKELRLQNLEGAFRVNGNIGTQIILIDDVATSGATLMHAARALKDAGAKKITGLVVAHGG